MEIKTNSGEYKGNKAIIGQVDDEHTKEIMIYSIDENKVFITDGFMDEVFYSRGASLLSIAKKIYEEYLDNPSQMRKAK